MRLPYLVVSLLMLFVSLPTLAEKQVFGRVETGLVTDECIRIRIRMDTGAQSASINAHNIQIFEKEGQSWVRFILDPDRTTKIHEMELPLVRMVKIRKRASETTGTDNFERRPVVMMPLTLGSQTHSIEVSLANRSYFNYGMLIGRSAMDQFEALIDPNLTFTSTPHCPSEKDLVD